MKTKTGKKLKKVAKVHRVAVCSHDGNCITSPDGNRETLKEIHSGFGFSSGMPKTVDQLFQEFGSSQPNNAQGLEGQWYKNVWNPNGSTS